MGFFRKRTVDTDQQQGLPHVAGDNGASEDLLPTTSAAAGGVTEPTSQTQTAPAPSPEPSLASSVDAPAMTEASSDDQVTRSMFITLAATCKEAGLLFDRCFEKMQASENAATVARTGYANGYPQAEASIRSFASMAATWESELISLLKELRELSIRGRRVSSDFMFLAGGPDGDTKTALSWCFDHVDEATINSWIADRPYVELDFGLTKASFIEMSNKLYVALNT